MENDNSYFNCTQTFSRSTANKLADKYPGWSPYAYTLCNPLNIIDRNGDTVFVNKFGTITRNDKTDNLVYMQNGNNFTLIGDLGGTININIIFKNLLVKNIKKAISITNPEYFKMIVETGGVWDYKNNKNTIYGLANGGKTKFLFNSVWMESQDIGNFHYGVVGKGVVFGLIPEWFLLYKAGEAQINSKTSRAEWQKGFLIPPYGDDPRDQAFIKQGFLFYYYYYIHK